MTLADWRGLNERRWARWEERFLAGRVAALVAAGGTLRAEESDGEAALVTPLERAEAAEAAEANEEADSCGITEMLRPAVAAMAVEARRVWLWPEQAEEEATLELYLAALAEVVRRQAAELVAARAAVAER